MRRALVVLVLLLPASLWGDAGFSLKNTDPSALFCWWAVPESSVSVLGALSLATRHPVAPGETVGGTLATGQKLVGVFVPWKEAPSWRTRVSGGVILVSELPVRGTLLIDRPAFAVSNRGRSLEGTLAEWGLPPPILVLDGRGDDWTAVPAALEWGTLFQPEGAWPRGWPRLLRLQVLDREGALWVHVTWESAPFPATGSGSLLLSRPGATLEIPLVGAETRVWSWSETGPAKVYGHRILANGELEAWVPWDRMTPADRVLWTQTPAQWLLAVGVGTGVQTYRLGSFLGEDLP